MQLFFSKVNKQIVNALMETFPEPIIQDCLNEEVLFCQDISHSFIFTRKFFSHKLEPGFFTMSFHFLMLKF